MYFTAIPPWDPAKIKRHKLLISANKNQGVNVILGKFRRVTKKCRDCKKNYYTYEEKRTDVNIAVNLFTNALNDKYDKAVLISGDSDMIPSVQAVQKMFPKKQLSLVVPIGRQAKELKQMIKSSMRMKEHHLKTSQFPNKLTLDDGKVIHRPTAWS